MNNEGILIKLERLLEKQAQRRQAEKDPGQIRDVVPWSEWIEDDYYCGGFRILFPVWRQEIAEVEASGVSEWVVTGSLGCGKSTASLALLEYRMYRHTCYRFPNRLYGLSDISPLVYAFLSTTQKTAMETGFSDFVKYIDSSPYFMEKCRRRPLKTRVEFPQSNIIALPATGRGAGGSVIARNIHTAILDEANFYKKSGSSATGDIKVTMATYQALMNRRRTRFATDREGALDDSMCVLVSSVDHDKSFTEQRINEAKLYGEKQHVSIANPWLVQPEKYSKERFVVFTGSESKPPEIVETPTQAMFKFEEDPKQMETASDLQRSQPQIEIQKFVSLLPFEMRAKFIEVPITFLPEFRRDPVAAIKDVAGTSVKATDRLFANGPAWTGAVLAGAQAHLLHPFAQENPCVSVENGVSLRDLFIASRMFDEKGMLLRHPLAPRFVHVDSSLSECPTGISMAHQAGSVLDDLTGLQIPLVEYDFNLEIVVPESPNDEVSLEEILKFLLWMHVEMGVKYGMVTYDMYASPLQLQVFRRYNIPADRLSIDANYGYVKDFTRAFTARTLTLYEYPPLRKSLFAVVDDREKHKIVRPPGVFKDILDAAVGAHHNCLEKAETYYAGTPQQIAQRSFVRKAYRHDSEAGKLAEDMIGWTLQGYDKEVSDRLKKDAARGVEVVDAEGKQYQ